MSDFKHVAILMLLPLVTLQTVTHFKREMKEACVWIDRVLRKFWQRLLPKVPDWAWPLVRQSALVIAGAMTLAHWLVIIVHSAPSFA